MVLTDEVRLGDKRTWGRLRTFGFANISSPYLPISLSPHLPISLSPRLLVSLSPYFPNSLFPNFFKSSLSYAMPERQIEGIFILSLRAGLFSQRSAT